MPEERVLWIVFGVLVPVVLALDLGVFHRRDRVIRFKEAVAWCTLWVSLALIFFLLIDLRLGHEPSVKFITGYLIEETLSVDNLFVFLLIFGYFSVPEIYQHKVLFWGILGALIMRGIFIAFGLAILDRFDWVIYLFGAFLVYTAVRLSLQKEMKFRPESNPVFRLFRRFVPLSEAFHGGGFFTRVDGRRVATLLLLVLVVVETTDVIFAVDSIPAVLAISTDPFIVYTSNIFAVLGLRSLYFVLAHATRRLVYLQYGLSVILGFLGLKMVFSRVYEVPGLLSLAVVVGVLAIVTVVSLVWGKGNREQGMVDRD
jgi:tellurite resistance protein TerC